MLFSQVALLCGSVSPLLGLCSAAVLEMHARALEPDPAESFVPLLPSNVSLNSSNSGMSNVANISALGGLLQIPA